MARRVLLVIDFPPDGFPLRRGRGGSGRAGRAAAAAHGLPYAVASELPEAWQPGRVRELAADGVAALAGLEDAFAAWAPACAGASGWPTAGRRRSSAHSPPRPASCSTRRTPNDCSPAPACRCRPRKRSPSAAGAAAVRIGFPVAPSSSPARCRTRPRPARWRSISAAPPPSSRRLRRCRAAVAPVGPPGADRAVRRRRGRRADRRRQARPQLRPGAGARQRRR